MKSPSTESFTSFTTTTSSLGLCIVLVSDAHLSTSTAEQERHLEGPFLLWTRLTLLLFPGSRSSEDAPVLYILFTWTLMTHLPSLLGCNCKDIGTVTLFGHLIFLSSLPPFPFLPSTPPSFPSSLIPPFLLPLPPSSLLPPLPPLLPTV